MKLYFSYFYNPNSVPVDGWKDRMTAPSNKFGQTSYETYLKVQQEGWICLGVYTKENTPENIWDKSRVERQAKRRIDYGHPLITG